MGRMTMAQEWRYEGRQEGRQEGLKVASRNAAFNLFMMGVDDVFIAQALDLSMREVTRLRVQYQKKSHSG